MEGIVFDAHDTWLDCGDGAPDMRIISVDIDGQEIDLTGKPRSENKIVDILSGDERTRHR